LDATAFISQLQAEMRAELGALDAELPKLAWLEVAERAKNGPIKLTDLDAAPEPKNLRRLKGPYPVGHGAADRHAQGGGAARWLPVGGHVDGRPRGHAR
jgi:hypothetical protein